MMNTQQNFYFRSLRSSLQLLLCFNFLFAISACQHTTKNKLTESPQAVVEKTTTEVAPIEAAASALQLPTPETPKTYSDIWQRIRAGYALPEGENDSIKKQINWYVNYRKYFEVITQQSEPYIYYVTNELETNKIPLEIALLPFIESAYNPNAKSPGRMSNHGMWQIAPITGKTFQLPNNNWYDGRKDVISSTRVAVKLLKQLNEQFNHDWLLTIAAYNAGDVIVTQAINKNLRAGKPTDFWSLTTLPKTTQTYVAKLYAFAHIVNTPSDYGYQLANIPNQPYFITLTVGPQINLAQLAEKSQVDANHLKNLNAGFNSWITDPTSERSLIVPVGKAEDVRAQLDSMPKVPVTKWIEHKVKNGDTLYDLSRHYGVSMKQIIESNGIKNNLIHPGQTLQIPLSNN